MQKKKIMSLIEIEF